MTLMTNPTDRDEAPPDAPSPDAPSAQQATAAPSPDAPRPAPQATAAPSSAPRNGSSNKLVVALLVALLGLGGAHFVHLGVQFQGLHNRFDALTAEIRDALRASEERQTARVDELAAQLREFEARQIQRVGDLARELRAEIRASEERQSQRLDELAADLREAMEVLVDIQGRLRALEASYVHVDARLVRLETATGLSPLPVAPPSSVPTADN